ncbi:hypothetical protein AX16_010971 [Volvariella volvacea WC 439]|nr:hypothetical protein AX16_010971 [Volvariella volvacea WC 439]
MATSGPDAQDALFEKAHERVPPQLRRASFRLHFPPSYALVGVYRLFTDKLLYKPAWDKCRHGARRGAIVGAIWTFLTFGIQKKFIELFLSNSSRVTGLSDDTVFGFKIPFSIYTYAAVLLLSSQVTMILKFFLYRNIRIARDRAWAQTVESRGKGPDFWQPYVEEWDSPPSLRGETDPLLKLQSFLGGSVGRMAVKLALLPFDLYPFVGLAITAWLKALGTGRYLHRQYFESKKMTKQQIAVFIEERKWDYRLFGFTAALLENIPIIGLAFTISNRVGAAMWAHDLEKRQHYVANTRKSGLRASD